MTPRCECGSSWIGYPVPKDALLVRDERHGVTVANGRTGQFVESIEATAGVCLDCGASVTVEEGRA